MDRIFSPACPKGLWPKSCATAMACVKLVFNPKYCAIVWLIESTCVTCSILVQI